MTDPRIKKLATLLVDYSLGVQPEQRVLLQGEAGAEPLMMAVFNICLERGASPFIWQYPEGMTDSIFRYGKP
jgi:aminopeptidase